MRRTIKLKSKPAFKSVYRSLLVKDWSLTTLRRTLKLLSEFLRGSGTQIQIAHDKARPSATRNEVVLGDNDLRFLLKIHEKFGGAALRSLPPAAARGYHATRALENLAICTWIYLDLQLVCNLRGDIGFFRDIQSILFLTAVDALLPELRRNNLADYAVLFANVLEYHAAFVWRDNPAHQQYLLSTLAHERGDRDAEGTALLAAFRLTDPQDHDYLTLAQSYWQFLIENERRDEAETFLLSTYRNAPREHLAEIKEMLDDTLVERRPRNA